MSDPPRDAICQVQTGRGAPCGCRARFAVEGTPCCGRHRAALQRPECSVCLTPIAPRLLHRTPCGHTFHRACLDRWLRRGKTTCPVCRGTLPNPHTRALGGGAPAGGAAGLPRFVGFSPRGVMEAIMQAMPTDVQPVVFPYILARVLVNPAVYQHIHPLEDTRRLLVEVALQSTSARGFMDAVDELGLLDAAVDPGAPPAPAGAGGHGEA